ncbi:MAG: hypothetical protein ACLUVG_21240 [Phocaeicola vulgatus]
MAWKIVAKEIVANQMPDARYDRIVFFSGGVDAIHAGINNPGKRNVLVSVPSIEVHPETKEALRNEKVCYDKRVLPCYRKIGFWLPMISTKLFSMMK